MKPSGRKVHRFPIHSSMRKKFLPASFLVLLLFLFAGSSAYACSCALPKPPCQTVWEADAVFVGTVLSVKTTDKGLASFESRAIKISVDESFRGVASTEVELFTASIGASCGYRFDVGQQYLVYGYKGDTGRLTTSICTRTRPLTQATEDLDYLRSLAVAPPGGTIKGEVRRIKRSSDGNSTDSAFADIPVIIENGSERSRTTTDEKGNFIVSGLKTGAYTVSLELPKGLRAGPDKSEVKVSDKGCASEYFVVETDGRLSGRVRNVSQSSVANAWLSVISADKGQYQGYTNSAYTNEQGVYEFSKIPPGKYILQIRFDDRSSHGRIPFPTMYYPGVSDPSQSTVIDLGEGQHIGDYDLTMPDLPKQRNLEGIVIASDGRILTRARVAYGSDSIIYDMLPVNAAGIFSLKVYEGVPLAIQARVDLGNGKSVLSDWLDIPPTGDATGLRLVIPSHLIRK